MCFRADVNELLDIDLEPVFTGALVGRAHGNLLGADRQCELVPVWQLAGLDAQLADRRVHYAAGGATLPDGGVKQVA